MKTKLKKHGVKILTMIICIVMIITALVIVPSADTYDDNLTHYWLYITAGRPVGAIPFSADVRIEYNTPFKQKATFIYNRVNGQNLFTARTFNSLNICIYGTAEIDEDTEEFYGGYMAIAFQFDPQLYIDHPERKPVLTFYFEWIGENYTGLTIIGENLHNDFSYVEFPWGESYGNYNLQLWLDSNYITNFSTNGYFNGLTDFDKLCRYSVISRPKLYTDAYIEGLDFGLEEGYNNGFDQGSIDGYQQGYTEGETIGYNEGYDNGYSDGNGDGYSLGYDEGEAYGWQNGFGAGQNDMAETSHTFKEMVFAIFDAPSRLIDSMLNFDIFGINLAGLVKTIITLAVVAVIVFAILKFTKG